MQLSLFEPATNQLPVPHPSQNEEPVVPFESPELRLNQETERSSPTRNRKNLSVFSFVSREQRELIATHPLRGFFDPASTTAFSPDQNTLQGLASVNQLAVAFFTQKVADLYQSRDHRFLTAQQGFLQLIDQNAKTFEILYEYQPCYLPNRDGKSFPQHHLQFISDYPTPLSGSGWYSDFFALVPVNEVSSLEEFLAYKIQKEYALEVEVLVNGKFFPLPAPDPVEAGF